jgi:3-oxosteroid 1-dehydrogenase
MATSTTNDRYDHSVDLLVVGTGAGAMAAAIRASDLGGDVLLIEKTELYGGSSAMSGGSLWVPCNHLMKRDGIIEDTPEEALEYLKIITQGKVAEEKLARFIEQAPIMLEYMYEKAHLDMFSMPGYADYYPETPGGKAGARACEPHRFDARRLGDEFDRMRPLALQEVLFGRMTMTATEAHDVLTAAPGYIKLALQIGIRYFLDIGGRLKSRRDRSLALGNALVAPLRLALMDRNVPLWLESPAREFIVEDGKVVGMVVEKQGRSIRIEAKRGVLLAAGGFESNDEMRKQYLPNPTEAEWTAANPGNTGDLIKMGIELGAATDFMDEAWWGPITVVPGEERARMLVVEKGLPRSMFVNSQGRRFLNESAPYDDICKGIHGNDSPDAVTVPCFMIFDATFRKQYPVGPLLPGMPIPKALKKVDYLKESNTLEGLAARLGIDPDGLRDKVSKLNGYAVDGKDPDFRRGESAYDRYYGDATVSPNPCLGPIDQPPYFGMTVYPGDLGTKGGLCTDTNAQVTRESGETIPGLFCIGNNSAAVMGPTYPGAGGTIAPAMTFGWVVAEELFGKNESA